MFVNPYTAFVGKPLELLSLLIAWYALNMYELPSIRYKVGCFTLVNCRFPKVMCQSDHGSLSLRWIVRKRVSIDRNCNSWDDMLIKLLWTKCNKVNRSFRLKGVQSWATKNALKRALTVRWIVRIVYKKWWALRVITIALHAVANALRSAYCALKPWQEAVSM